MLFRNDPPLELQNVSGLPSGKGEVGYITFVLFPRHLARQRREEVISHIQTFRDYFHYHIKASKVSLAVFLFSRSCLTMAIQAYIHSRMRRRTADFLQGMMVYSTAVCFSNVVQYYAALGPIQKKRRGRPQVGGRSKSNEWQQETVRVLEGNCTAANIWKHLELVCFV